MINNCKNKNKRTRIIMNKKYYFKKITNKMKKKSQYKDFKYKINNLLIIKRAHFV